MKERSMLHVDIGYPHYLSLHTFGAIQNLRQTSWDEWMNTVGKNDLKKRDFSKTLFILTLDRGPSLKDRGIQKSVSE